jgi:Carboxypeptidase regulatory-like domain
VRNLTRILAAVIVAAFSVGPVSAATAPSAPVAGVNVELRGPQTYRASSDATRAFGFLSVTPGVYVLAAEKPGYQSVTESDFAVLGGQTQTVQVTLHAFTSLRTIATVRAYGQATFNTSTASVDVIPAQAFVDQADPQVGPGPHEPMARG